MAVTIIDVAKKAGVSKSTVSLVLNGEGKISPNTRAEVIKAIKELKYIPNRGARSIVTNRTGNIGIMIMSADVVSQDPYSPANKVSSFSVDVERGVESAVSKTHYGLIYARCNGQNPKELPQVINQSYIDGLIIIGGIYTPEFLLAIEALSIPTVITGANVQSKFLSSIYCDNRLAMKRSVDYLISRGRRDIAFINTPVLSSNSQLKLEGYKDALLENGLEFRSSLVEGGYISSDGGQKAIAKLLDSGQRIDAVATAFDGIAAGVIRELYLRNIPCPNQIAVMGFEDGWLASHMYPRLSTIRLPKVEIGKQLLVNLLALMNGDISPGFKLYLDSELIVRETT